MNMKDHEIQKLINQLRDIAVKYGHTQQLRERISNVIIPLFKSQPPKRGLPDITRFPEMPKVKTPPKAGSSVGLAFEDTYMVTRPETKALLHQSVIMTEVPASALEPIIADRHLLCSARFDCPSCGKGIRIEINKKMGPGE